MAPLHLVASDAERTRILVARAVRAAKIDKLGVDRSVMLLVPTQGWSVEAEAREPRFASIRADQTITTRMDAWRHLFAQ